MRTQVAFAVLVASSMLGKAVGQDAWGYNFGCSGPPIAPATRITTMRVVPGSAVGQIETEVLLVAGRFDTIANGLAVNGLAIWTGTEWKKFPQSNGVDFSGFRGSGGSLAVVEDIIKFGEDVFFCGEFVTANGIAAATIARWDQGPNSWSNAGSGLVDPLFTRDLTIHQNDLFAISLDDDPAFFGTSVKSLRWDPSSMSWDWIGRNLIELGFFNGAIESTSTGMYCGGQFDLGLFSQSPEQGGVFDSQSDSWAVIGSTNNFVDSPRFSAMDIEEFNGDVYFGGDKIFHVNETTIRGPLERFDGSSFQHVIDPSDAGFVADMDEWNGLLIVGSTGEISPPFTTPGDLVKSWNGTSWADMGNGISTAGSGSVLAVQAFGDHVYVGGRLVRTGGGRGLQNISRFGPFCAADLTGSSDPNDRGRFGVPDGQLDADDFFHFLDLFSASDPKADMDLDGDVDSDDFFAYLALFSAGC